ncbi:MAG: pseudouridine-5'-phosphate glycosidase [Planktomarina sp.]|nr:pseudouridine-5'-phosphate glycosidase [Planktomarina sp.]
MKIVYNSEVNQARNKMGGYSKPIVALESTIITHGMPYPKNIQVAREVEEIVRKNGVIPATIAILDGSIHIGLEDAELKKLAQTKDVVKVSRADIAFTVANGKTGATTVAATMIVAKSVGIQVFATGGIGGVHRGSELNFDISADLRELALTDVTVVAAGPKAILDIPKTMEVLETNGVPVLVYGQNFMPAFWSSTSNVPAPLRVNSVDEIVASMLARKALGLDGGQLVANPVPLDDQISANVIEPLIEEALIEAKKLMINAKAVTPFLLNRIFELTKGKSLTTNIALVKNNAQLASEISKTFFIRN